MTHNDIGSKGTVIALSLLLGMSGCASPGWFTNNSASKPAASAMQQAAQPYGPQSTPSYPPTNTSVGQSNYATQQSAPAPSTYGNSGTQPLYSLTPPGNSNVPYYAAQPPSTPTITTARMIDPNVVPVGATDVGPPSGDTMPFVGMSGPAPAPQYAGPSANGQNPNNQAPWVGPAPGQLPGQVPGNAPPVTVVPATIVDSTDDSGFDLEKLEPDYTWKEFKNMVGWGPDEALAKAMYADGQMFYRDKKYDEAAERFYIASWRWPDSLLEEDAMFLEAESYFFADRYGKAQDAYSGLLKQHENTRYLDTTVARLFAIATYWEQLDMQSHHWPLTPNATDRTTPVFDTYGNMLAAYRSVWLSDPTGPLADVAVWRVANSHFRRGEWEDAAYHYGLIRKNHPKSKYQKDAHLLELQARMRLYQGARYSASPLNEAEEIANQTLKQFPGQLGDEEARVRQTKAQIVEFRAERDWMMAEYYDSKEYYGAAKYYYRDILDKFPRTTYGDRTRQRMTEIQGLPDEPPKYFIWLTGLFERDQ